jgi:serine/threonine protein kinase/Tol biopolymer transport system component
MAKLQIKDEVRVLAKIILMAEAGQTIGPYQLQGQLGAGGMGEVYRALDTRVGRQVAFKILPESLAGNEERRRRFEQEARLAASLNHPNIMAIYDVGLNQHPPYIVAELVPGESLRALIEKGPMPVRKVVDVAAQIAAGLSAAHAAGIVHRDLKPENVIVTPDGTAKVLDFGVARMQPKPSAATETVTLAHTLAGSVVGTAAYMSPEQARAEDVDPRSDQFSLGLLIYEMASGRQAFQRPSAVQTMAAIVEDDPAPIDRPIPAQLRWILERCLSKERDGRYESTRDLARDLAYLRDHFGELTSAASGTQPAVAAIPRRANRTAAWIFCALAGFLATWCIATLTRDSAAIDLSQYRMTPFGTSFEVQSYSAWSPDGKSIAFLAVNEAGKLQLFVQGVDGATPVQITPAGARLNMGSPPFWSPDARSLYFRCSMEGAPSGLCRIPAAGGSAVLVQNSVQAAAISPDGKTLAIWPSQSKGDNVGLSIATPPESAPRKYAPMPFQSTQFYNNPALAFSPNGKSIVLCVALDTRGENCWQLPWPESAGRAVFPRGLPFSYTPQFTWLPDSRFAVFSDSLPNSQPQLYMADTAQGRYWPILAEDRPTTLPSLAPDGSRLAYTSVLSHSDLIAVPIGEGSVTTLIGGTRNEQRVNASPVAQQLVYVTDRRGAQEVWIKSLTEDWERPLLTPHDVQTDGEPAQQFFNPVFSPDGRRIAVSAKSRSGVHLYTVFTSGGAAVRATSANDMEFCATWSPDGNWLAYSALDAGTPQLRKVRPGSGDAPITIAATYGGEAPVWSPDGAWIADHLNGKLLLVSPDGKQQHPLPGDAGPVAWSHDSKTLYQVSMGPAALFAIDVATGQERKLRDLPGLDPYSNGNPGLSAAITSDQKSIVYTVNRARSEIWILDGIQHPSYWYLHLLGKY